MDGFIGCLQVEIHPIGQSIDALCNRIGESINVSCLAIGNHIDVTCKRIGDNINVKCSPIGKVLNVVCAPICAVNKVFYLRVDPDYVWLTPDMLSGEFDIYSNVSWRID